MGYVRVSTQEQADSGLGLAAQRKAIKTECHRRGWHLSEIHEDAGASGRSLKGRPGLAVALEKLRSGKADGLLVAKLDRLSRSLVDFAGLMATARRERWNLVALDLGIDLSTPSGEFMANVMASAAQWERRIIGQRTREALAIRRQEGFRLGAEPMISEEIATLIVSERRGGATLQGICNHLNEQGVPTTAGGRCWWPATVRRVLQRHNLTATSSQAGARGH